jgi:hypothetical protein
MGNAIKSTLNYRNLVIREIHKASQRRAVDGRPSQNNRSQSHQDGISWNFTRGIFPESKTENTKGVFTLASEKSDYLDRREAIPIDKLMPQLNAMP